jgi:hypothetical protein
MSNPVDVPLTWNAYVTQIANMAVMQTTIVGGIVQGVDDSFNVLIPQAVNYAELRIQRDLDLLPARTSLATAVVSGNPNLTLSVDAFVTLETIVVNNGGALSPLLPVSREFIQNVYLGGTQGVPQYFAMYGGDAATGGNTSNIVLLGPTPDSNYPITITGMVRLPSLYLNATALLAGTATTFISAYLGDLLIQASMIYVSQFQRNFGPALPTNDGSMPGAYESQYQILLQGAQSEEGRKKFAASGWSSMSQPTVATPSR